VHEVIDKRRVKCLASPSRNHQVSQHFCCSKHCMNQVLLFGTIAVAPQLLTLCACSVTSGGNSLFRWWGGAKTPKFPTKLSNFRQPPPPPPQFALEKAVFSPLLGQNFRKFVIFREGGGGGRSPSRPTKISATECNIPLATCLAKFTRRIASFWLLADNLAPNVRACLHGGRVTLAEGLP
jgi:hypothetical protein